MKRVIKKAQKKILENQKLIDYLKMAVLKGQGEVCSELVTGAMSSVHKKAKTSPKKFGSDAYKTAMQALNALEKIAKELEKINKALR